MPIPMKRYINRPQINPGDTVRVTYANLMEFNMKGEVLKAGITKCLVALGSLQYLFFNYEVELIKKPQKK